MSYAKEYVSARKVYLDKVTPLKPSESFLRGFVGEEKCYSLAQKLDEVNGKLPKMKQAYQDFSQYYVKYIEKLSNQITKENGVKDKDKLKSPLTVYRASLQSISVNFFADLTQLTQEEERKAKAVDLQAVTNGANAAAKVAAERNLAKALEDLIGRRKKHLEAATKFLKEAEEDRKKVVVLNQAARKAVGEVLGLAKLSRFGEARKLADEAISAAKQASQLAKHSDEEYTSRIDKPFMPDRALQFANYEKDWGLLPSQKGAFLNGEKPAKDLFTKATDLGNQALKNVEIMKELAKQAEEAAQTADQAANGKDIRPELRKSLALALNFIEENTKQMNQSIVNARENGTGLMQSSNRIVNPPPPDPKVKNPPPRPNATDAQHKIEAIGLLLVKLRGIMQQIQNTANGQTMKVPQDLKGEEEFKTSLANLGMMALKAKQSLTSFDREATEMVEKLKQVK